MKGEQERRDGRECQSAISPRQASDSQTFRGTRAPRGYRKALCSVNVRNANFSNLLFFIEFLAIKIECESALASRCVAGDAT